MTQTLYEWAGGAEALERLTEHFYRGILGDPDPLLEPIFRGMSPDHPKHVAIWLGEVFGGPPRYTEAHGGYPHMLSKHLGLALTPQQRRRWVERMSVAADDVGLPADPEFRSAFMAYIEWGSRIALGNSQAGSAPPPEAPVPHWGWGEAPPYEG